MTPDAQIQALSRALGLEDSPQDWGIINADSARIEEFLGACEGRQLTAAQQYAMGGLVLASLNEALESGANREILIGDIKCLLASGLHGLSSQIEYWASLDGEEFPIGPLLRCPEMHA